ncbi:sensor domain-containing protein [Streptomyces glaucosporus]|uniref:sensor domain-containing protein n=1 Tax=Streptomyces glaucosporus TaxID=284044 RepID=UPI0031D8A44B
MHGFVRRVLLSAALSGAVAAGAACGPADDAGQGGPPTAAELAAALPEGDDLPGFTARPQDMPLLEKEDVVTADDPACRPVSDMMSVRPEHPRRAMVWATLTADGAPADAPPGSLVLTSHTAGDARAWLDDLRKALSECEGFTATSRRGWTYRFTVKPLPPPDAGDESVAYVLTNTSDIGGKGNVMTVVRTGSVLASYLLSRDTEWSGAVPASVAGPQHERLRDAGAGR